MLLTLTLAGFLGQGVVAVALGAILYAYYGRYRRDYLLQWSWSWWALAVYLSGGGLALVTAYALGPIHPVRTLLSLVSTTAGYWNAAWLLFGIYEIAVGDRVSRRTGRRILGGLAIVAVVSVLAFAATVDAATERMLLRVGLRTLVAGTAFAVTGFVVWRLRSRQQGGMGPLMLAVALVLYGLAQLHYFGHTVYQFVTGVAPAYIAYFGYLDLVLLSLIGLGMVAWLLEEERNRFEVAAERVEFLASHDPLTGLPNRHLFLAELRQVLEERSREGGRVGVLCLDLYGFKWVNESLGHRIGDMLLREAGVRLRETVGASGEVARLGGDEYAVLARDVERSKDLRALAARIVEAFDAPFEVAGRAVVLVPSVGLTVFPDDAREPEALVSNAAAALAVTDRQGRLVAWKPEMSQLAAEGFALEGEIQRAFDRDELVLHFQPIVDVATGTVERVEALLRWQHPDRGLLLPADFFPAIDLAALSDRLDLWVLERALVQLGACRRQGWSELRMAVNLAPANLGRPNLAGEIRRRVQRSGLDPEDLEIEITEAAAVQVGGASLDVLGVLDRSGIGISLDDFGTGYSSLSYLRQLPVDVLKIDRSFVHDLGTNPQGADITRAIINLGHDLGLQVVGEGVESDLQRRLLEEQGCDQLQGFAIGPPVPGEELDGALAEIEAEERLRRADGVA